MAKKHRKTCNCGPCANMKANIEAAFAKEKELQEFYTKYPHAIQIKDAFFEGYSSYSTHCNAFNTVEQAWDESSAKLLYDSIIGKA